MKNEKKKCRNGLGYCPTVSQYSGKLYCDTTSFRCEVGCWACHYTKKLYCDLAVVRLDGPESVVQHCIVYCSWVVGRVCHNTPSVL